MLYILFFKIQRVIHLVHSEKLLSNFISSINCDFNLFYILFVNNLVKLFIIYSTILVYKNY